MSEWYDSAATKRRLNCILQGCTPCTARLFCKAHDKPCKDNAPSIPLHCDECGEYLYDEKKDTKGLFGA